MVLVKVSGIVSNFCGNFNKRRITRLRLVHLIPDLMSEGLRIVRVVVILDKLFILVIAFSFNDIHDIILPLSKVSLFTLINSQDGTICLRPG